MRKAGGALRARGGDVTPSATETTQSSSNGKFRLGKVILLCVSARVVESSRVRKFTFDNSGLSGVYGESV